MGIHTFELYTRVVNLLRKNEQLKKSKRVLTEVSEKDDGEEDFINRRIEEICSQEKLSVEEVIYFVCSLVSLLAVKYFLDVKVVIIIIIITIIIIIMIMIIVF